jgi:GTP-binding protein Era
VSAPDDIDRQDVDLPVVDPADSDVPVVDQPDLDLPAVDLPDGDSPAIDPSVALLVPQTRSGFVALAGRPNVGKSTLVNTIVGGKVAIVSDRPQTTRRAIRGVHTDGSCQLVLVDLPGVQRPRDALTERMAGRVRQELDGSDAALLLLNGEQGIGPGDRYIARALTEGATPVAIAVNKVDRLDRAATVAMLTAAAELQVAEEIFPISARTGKGVPALVEHLSGLMPAGHFMFPADSISDQPLGLLLAELVREAAIRRTFQELPHAVEAIVEEIERPREGLTRVRALIWVETESQKGIVVGAGGRMIKAIGSAARKEIERELGCHVHLDLSVRVRRDWRGDEGLLDRLGIT